YDQAIYPDTITWAYSGGSALGNLRQVKFLRTPRTDWTDTTASTHVSFFDRYRLDTVEVWIGSNLVRKYAFTYDYSIDRDPTYTWGGGATGDLTLRSITMYGADGTSTLPSLTFAYTAEGRLANVSNGIGGTVAYA